MKIWPSVSPFLEFTLEDDDRDVGDVADFDCIGYDVFIVNYFVGLFSRSCTYYQFGMAILNPQSKLGSRKSTKYNGMDGSYPCTSEFSNNTLNNHGHINDDRISGLHPKILDQTVGELVHPSVELLNSDV